LLLDTCFGNCVKNKSIFACATGLAENRLC
jgi:hypothetical protein